MRRFLWIGLALVVLVGMIYWTRRVTRRVKITIDVPRVEKDIRDHLPMGTSRSEVEAYLDQRKFPHSYTGEGSKEYPEYWNTEAAMIHGASQGWLVRGDIQILFKFDDQGKLIHYSVKEIFTGP